MRIGLVIAVVLVLGATGRVRAFWSEQIELRQAIDPDQSARVELSFKVAGTLQVPGERATALRLRSTGKIAFQERLLATADSSRRAIRYYTAGSVDGSVDRRRISLTLRDEIRLIVADLRDGRPFLFSPRGALTAGELDLLQGPMDSHTLGGLLPTTAVAVADTWKPAAEALAAIFDLDEVGTNEVTAKLEHSDRALAIVAFAGRLAGTANATQTELELSGQLVFDRKRNSIIQAIVTQKERREPGPIEPGFVVEAELRYRREPAAGPSDLALPELKRLAATPGSASERLVYQHPEGRYRFYFARGWQLYYGDTQLVVLRLIEDGELVAQCNVSLARSAQAGQHMEPSQFRAQVRQALGTHFRRFILQQELPSRNDYWLYRLTAAGMAGDLPVLWSYYLAAGPQGQQLVFTFTLNERFSEQFGSRDRSIVESVEFD